MLSVLFVLAATLTLLPAILAKLGPRVDKLALPWVHSGEHRSPRFAALGRAAVAAAVALRAAGARRARRARVPVLRARHRDALDHGRAGGRSSRQGYDAVQDGFGPGAPGALQVVGPRAPRTRPPRSARRDPGVAQVLPPSGRRRPEPDPGGPGRPTRPMRPSARRSSGCASSCPAEVLVGGAGAENHDLERSWPRRRRS